MRNERHAVFVCVPCFCNVILQVVFGKCPGILMPRDINRTTTVYCHCDLFTIIFFFYFPCYSLKLECEKLASEKIEIQRHYVMVSISRSCMLRNCRLGGSCRRTASDVAQISIRNMQMSLRSRLIECLL
jgi:hypothetical protein